MVVWSDSLNDQIAATSKAIIDASKVLMHNQDDIELLQRKWEAKEESVALQARGEKDYHQLSRITWLK